jgi:hypothetical protein
MPDRTWAPEVVEPVCIAYHSRLVWNGMPEDRTAERASHGTWDTNRKAERESMRAALSASPLGDALDLIERMEKALKSYERYYEAGGNNIGFEAVAHSLAAEAAAFVARVREG